MVGAAGKVAKPTQNLQKNAFSPNCTCATCRLSIVAGVSGAAPAVFASSEMLSAAFPNGKSEPVRLRISASVAPIPSRQCRARNGDVMWQCCSPGAACAMRSAISLDPGGAWHAIQRAITQGKARAPTSSTGPGLSREVGNDIVNSLYSYRLRYIQTTGLRCPQALPNKEALRCKYANSIGCRCMHLLLVYLL